MPSRSPSRRRPRADPRRATVLEVARRAGVSTATVSRTLSTPSVVRPETRRRVLAAVRDLDYHANRTARGLAHGGERTFALLVPDLRDPGCAALVGGAAARCREAGALLAVADRSEDPASESEIAARLAARTDGVVLYRPDLTDDAAAEIARQGPLVSVERRVGSLPAVLGSPGAAVSRAAEHLEALGHVRIAFVAHLDPRDGPARRAAVEALRGSRPTLLTIDRPGFDQGYEVAGRILDRGATAIVAFDGELVRGLVAGLRAAGADVPGDVSVVAATESAVGAAHRPALTTVAHPTAEMASAAIDLLARRSGAATGAPLRTVRFAPRVTRAASTGPAPRAPRNGGSASPRGGREAPGRRF